MIILALNMSLTNLIKPFCTIMILVELKLQSENSACIVCKTLKMHDNFRIYISWSGGVILKTFLSVDPHLRLMVRLGCTVINIEFKFQDNFVSYLFTPQIYMEEHGLRCQIRIVFGYSSS